MVKTASLLRDFVGRFFCALKKNKKNINKYLCVSKKIHIFVPEIIIKNKTL